MLGTCSICGKRARGNYPVASCRPCHAQYSMLEAEIGLIKEFIERFPERDLSEVINTVSEMTGKILNADNISFINLYFRSSK